MFQLLGLFVGTSAPRAALAATAGYCGTPAASGSPATISGVVNTYYAAPVGTLTAGTTTVTLGTRNAAGSNVAFGAGDLVLIMQMQDGSSISTSNGTTYGTGSTTAGTYEYAVVKTAGGATITVVNGLLHGYADSTTKGQAYQIIRVPQYGSTTLTSGLAPAVWNGSSGGVLAVDVSITLALGGATVSASGLGFRGGGGQTFNGGTGANTDYVTSDTIATNGEKGEGIGGTPYWVYNAAGGLLNVTDTLPSTNASRGKGAPLNAGGGGTDNNPPANDENAGGGGGGNGGAGGQGGWNWSPIYPTLYSATNPTGVNENANADGTTGTGGVGGHVFTPSATSIVLGGGGGAGDRNNSVDPDSSGGAGGGIVLIRAGALTGTGTVSANGASGVVPSNDGGGGGGAGGTVVVLANSGFGGLTASATGAAGTNANPGAIEHGPGGGGGGGAVVTSAAVTSTLTGGSNGFTGTATNDAYGAAAGASGVTVTVAPTGPDGAQPGEACAFSVVTGPYGAPAATGNYQATTPDNMHDFTAGGFACSNGATINNGTFTCTVPAAGITIPNTLQNTGSSNDTFTLAAGAVTGWTVTFYNASCTGGGATWPICTRGTAITAPVTVAAGATLNYVTVFTATAAVTPWVATGATITATGSTLGDNNATYDDFYPGGPLKITKSVVATTTHCPAGTTPSGPANGSTTAVCPGGVLTYTLAYQNVAASFLAPGSAALGTEPAFATNALNLASVVITEDGATGNNWATNTFGLNAVPVDSLYGAKTTITPSNGTQYASGTYPSMTAGYTKFTAALDAGGSPATVKPGDSGTITFSVTAK
ncbi:MAG: beta strand repeat-containing protein [Vulcanimicrobiaceae bacterium]